MAHGSHHSGSHHSSSSSHYHHYHHYYGDRSNIELKLHLLALAIVLFIVVIINFNDDNIRKERISGRVPLVDTYEVTDYLYDAEGYFSEPEAIVDGLKYFHERTGVQLVVRTINQNFSDEKALSLYNQLFNDESHVLLVIPTTYQQSIEDPIQFYAIGDDANSVVCDDTIDYLLDKINNSSSGGSWQYHLEEIANIIVNNE